MKKTIDDFDKIYSPDSKVKSEVFDDDCQEGWLETYGKDFEQVQTIYSKTPKRVWTCVDGDDGNVYMINGLAVFNRIYYLITNEDCKSENEEYLISE